MSWLNYTARTIVIARFLSGGVKKNTTDFVHQYTQHAEQQTRACQTQRGRIPKTNARTQLRYLGTKKKKGGDLQSANSRSYPFSIATPTPIATSNSGLCSPKAWASVAYSCPSGRRLGRRTFSQASIAPVGCPWGITQGERRCCCCRFGASAKSVKRSHRFNTKYNLKYPYIIPPPHPNICM